MAKRGGKSAPSGIKAEVSAVLAKYGDQYVKKLDSYKFRELERANAPMIASIIIHKIRRQTGRKKTTGAATDNAIDEYDDEELKEIYERLTDRTKTTDLSAELKLELRIMINRYLTLFIV